MTTTQSHRASAAHRTPTRGVPALDLSRPRRHVLLASAVMGALIAITAGLPLPETVTTTASARLQAEPHVVRHAEGGVIARLHVREGAEVVHGAPLATFDTRVLDSQIAGLRRQIEGTLLHVSGLKEEASGLASADRAAPQRQRLASLEAQIATAEQEVIGLEVRLAMASEERNRVDLKAPISGRIAKILVAEGASVPAGGALVAIQTAADRLTLEAVFAIDRSIAVEVGREVSIREAGAAFSAPELVGRIEQIVSEDARGLRVRVTAALPDDPTRAGDTREHRFHLSLVTGRQTLLDRFSSALATPTATAADLKSVRKAAP